MNLTTLSCIIVLVSGAQIAWSQVPLSWAFDTPHFIVKPADHLIVTATITNLSADSYTIPGGGGSFSGDLQKIYSFTGMADLFEKTVPGHGILQFTFGALTPIGDSVAPGIYYADPAGINFAGVDEFRYLQFSQNTFDITVVPEPSTLTLLGFAGAVSIGSIVVRSHAPLTQRSSVLKPLAEREDPDK